MRLRCTNDTCRSAEAFRISYTSDEYEMKDGEFKLTKKGKKSKPLEESFEYKAKCKRCCQEDTVEKMIEAYNDPMKYFDTDNLCDCGGEIWMEYRPVYNDKKELVCTIENGVPGVKTQQVRVCERCGKIYD